MHDTNRPTIADGSQTRQVDGRWMLTSSRITFKSDGSVRLHSVFIKYYAISQNPVQWLHTPEPLNSTYQLRMCQQSLRRSISHLWFVFRCDSNRITLVSFPTSQVKRFWQTEVNLQSESHFHSKYKKNPPPPPPRPKLFTLKWICVIRL